MAQANEEDADGRRRYCKLKYLQPLDENCNVKPNSDIGPLSLMLSRSDHAVFSKEWIAIL